MDAKTGLLLAVVFALGSFYLRGNTPLPPVTENPGAEYDYIVVGAGAAGATLAARLSEDDVEVLVLEAGSEESYSLMMEVPIMAFFLQHTKHTWNEYTVPQKYSCQSMRDKRCYLPRGRGLGGGSSHNCMMYVRGNKEDYDRWEQLGATGWGYDNVLPYFKKSESILIPSLKRSKYHNSDGGMEVTEAGFTYFTKAFVTAAVEAGFNHSYDINGEHQEGFAAGHVTVGTDGKRVSTVKSFLRPAMTRPNLHVSVDSFVTKVILEGRRAIGVEYVKDGIKRFARARKEVILSAGAIASPKILMLSGIGPKQHLESLKIPVVRDLPVGDNHQDHVMTQGINAVVDAGRGVNQGELESFYEMLSIAFSGRGKSCAGCAIDGTGFVRVPSQPQDRKAPFLQMITQAKLANEIKELLPLVQNFFNYDDQYMSDVFEVPEMYGREGFHLIPTLLHPASRGTVRLASADPFDPALIDTQYLSDERDVKILLDGIRISQKMANTKALKFIGSKVISTPIKACKEYEYDTDEYWTCYIRHNTLTVYHSCGTCRMGNIKNKDTVVDPELRVKGVDNLRVVDASIMPEITSGNTNAPSIMIGEKGADIIRGKVTV